MSGSVRAILDEIEALPEPDRLALERELSRRLDAQWQDEVHSARQTAQKQGIDQQQIDAAIARRRSRR